MQLSRSKRPRRIVSCRRLDADDAAAGRQFARGKRRAGEQPAASARHEQQIELADFLDEFARGRALAGDDVRVIVGRNDRQAALARQAAPDCFAIVALAIVEDDLSAVALRRHAFDGGRVGRHDDDSRNAKHPACERDRLRVVAR